MSMIQVGLLGIIGIIFAVQLKQEKSEVAVYLCIVITLIIFVGMTDHLEQLVTTLREIGNFV